MYDQKPITKKQSTLYQPTHFKVLFWGRKNFQTIQIFRNKHVYNIMNYTNFRQAAGIYVQNGGIYTFL